MIVIGYPWFSTMQILNLKLALRFEPLEQLLDVRNDEWVNGLRRLGRDEPFVVSDTQPDVIGVID
jgi:hypothetical protein